MTLEYATLCMGFAHQTCRSLQRDSQEDQDLSDKCG
jgi:hypothetical protein